MGSVEGDSNEQPIHTVKITKPFYLGIYEVTQAEWADIMGTAPAHFKGKNLPVVNVSWTETQEFLKRLSDKEKKTYRLPTEAEWEYACRAGTKTAYSFGDDLKQMEEFCWFEINSESKIHPVGTKKPNPWGFFDMHGNVWEWCADWMKEYSATEVTDPKGPSAGTYRIYRGGSWDFAAGSCRSANRDRGSPGNRYNNIGFRVVLVPSQP